MSRQHKGKGMKNAKDSSSKPVKDVHHISIFGRYSEAKMIAQLKRIAMDPCRLQFSMDNIQSLCNQIVRIRKFMALEDSEIPSRKRKLGKFFKDKLKDPSCFALPNQQNVTKLSRRQLSNASSVSCLLNSVDSAQCHDEKTVFDSRTSSSLFTFDNALTEKQVSTESSFLGDMVHCNYPKKDASPTVDTDESINDSNPISPENQTPDGSLSVNINDAINYLNSPTLSGTHKRYRQPPQQSMRLLNFIGDHLQRKAIPVGPHFQADVPEWCGPVNRSILPVANENDPDNSKWLGTRVWPIKIGKMKTTGRTIGKGRSNSCRCVLPGSADCIRHHIFEKRQILQSDLGPAFLSWKFDEMGDQVSKSWSRKEQQTFESLVKRRSSSNGKNFLKRALKCFSNKCRKDIINYYFNFYVPHRMSLQTRSSSVEQVDTDDEDLAGDFNYLGVQKRSGGRFMIRCSKDIRS